MEASDAQASRMCCCLAIKIAHSSQASSVSTLLVEVMYLQAGSLV